RFALLLDDLAEPLAQRGCLRRRFRGAPIETGRTLVEQHDLVLGLDARLLAVVESALRGLQLALDLEQRQLLVVQLRLDRRELGAHALTPRGLFLPALEALDLAA